MHSADCTGWHLLKRDTHTALGIWERMPRAFFSSCAIVGNMVVWLGQSGVMVAREAVLLESAQTFGQHHSLEILLHPRWLT